MDYKRIELLLEKYWACETSPQEETELRCFFKKEQKLPAHLEELRELFVFQQQEREVHLTEEFDRKMLESIGYKRISPVRSRFLLRIVAAVVLVIAVGVVAEQRSGIVDAKKQTPEQALAEVKQALTFVSLKMNQGRQIVETNVHEIKEMLK